ncbi:MAG: tetratricopeptide repeat protein [Opitutales bacterium]
MRLILILLSAVAAASGTSEREEAARKAYLAGDSATALETWSALCQEQGVTAPRLAAMGNAEWKLGRRGRAMVCWERALSMDPGNPVAQAGIAHATAVGGVDRPTPTWQERYASTFAPNTWTWLAVGSLWTLLLTWGWPRIRGHKLTELHHRLLLASFTILLLAGPGAWGSWTSGRRAVMRLPDAAIKLTPTALGEPLSQVGEGDVVRTQRVLNRHVRVELPGGQTGWVPQDAIESVWGVTPPRSLDATAQP